MSFPCTKCGACCRRSYLLSSFEYTNTQTGSCSKLEENLCSIYKDRPVICNIGISKILVFNGTLKEYYKATAIFCNKFIKEDKMNSKYLIDLTQFKD